MTAKKNTLKKSRKNGKTKNHHQNAMQNVLDVLIFRRLVRQIYWFDFFKIAELNS
jgi:hypothetical protein